MVKIKREKQGVFGQKKVSNHTFKTEGKGHGRIEKRDATVAIEKEGKSLGVNILRQWPSLSTVIKVDSHTTNVRTEESKESTRYYVSSRNDLSAEQALSHVRNHWGIENKLHWSLDVTFREDESRHRAGSSANNCAILRKMAFNLLKMDSSDKTLPLKQQKAVGNNAYLLKLLLQNTIKKE